jgi:hypothetical protein
VYCRLLISFTCEYVVHFYCLAIALRELFSARQALAQHNQLTRISFTTVLNTTHRILCDALAGLSPASVLLIDVVYGMRWLLAVAPGNACVGHDGTPVCGRACVLVVT